MKKKGKMAACLILLVLLLAVLVVLTKKNSTADADSSSSDSGADAEKVVGFSKDDVTALSFQINGETVSFTKTAGDDDTDIWTYDQEDGFPLDEGKITNVLSSLSSMTAERVIEGDEIDSMADFGLETPSQEVVVTAGDEKTTIHVGDKNSSSRYYIYLNDDTSKVYLVSTSLGTMFPSDMMEWATTESMPSVTAENITKLQVEGENGYTLTKEVSAADSALQTDEWQVVDADGAAHGGDADSIGTMTSAVASLSFGRSCYVQRIGSFPVRTGSAKDDDSRALHGRAGGLRLTIQQRQILLRIPQQILHQATALQRALLPKRQPLRWRKIWYCMSAMQMRTAVLIT